MPRHNFLAGFDMIEKQNDATYNRPEGERPLDATFIRLPFKEKIGELKNEKAWQTNDRNAITLLHHPRMRVVLIALHEGAELKKHTADGPITIHCLEGAMRVTVNEDAFDLQPMEALAVDDQVPHAVKATQESVFLLTMGPGAEKTF